MKSLCVVGLLVGALSSGAGQWAQANEAETAVKNHRRAIGQQFKAQRAAARGDMQSAAKHAENARRDEIKAYKNAQRAIRKGESLQ